MPLAETNEMDVSEFPRSTTIDGGETTSVSMARGDDYESREWKLILSQLKQLPEPVFCDLCADITIDGLQSEAGYPHLGDARDLELSSKICHLCNLFKLAIYANVKRLLGFGDDLLNIGQCLDKMRFYYREENVVLHDPCPIVLTLYSNGVISIGTIKQPSEESELAPSMKRAIEVSLGYVLCHASEHVEGATLGISKSLELPNGPMPLFSRTDDELLFDWFLYSLFDEHDFGCDNTYDSILPTRVLDLGDPVERGNLPLAVLNQDLCLIESHGLRASYVTLSYCWGSYRGCLTETDSYNDRCRSIVYDKLPLGFQQAVSITRKLGFRYLWIDALCIVQDSKMDWEQEALNMAGIYRNCCIRLAATVAKSPLEGFFPPKPIVTSVRVPHLDRNDYKGFFARHFITLPKSYAEDVSKALLNTRGWVVQERLLAPNTIHFCEDHIYIEVPWCILTEDRKGSLFGWHSTIDKFGEGRSRLMERARGRNYFEGDDTRDSWMRIAELYAAAKLGFATDRLVAICGLADDKRENGASPYEGAKFNLGLWETTAYMDLLWTGNDDFKLRELDSLNLPSWTWLAYLGPIAFVKDKRTLRVASTATGYHSSINVLGMTGPYDQRMLPLEAHVSLKLRAKLYKIASIGRKFLRNTKCHRHETEFDDSPFDHWAAQPIPLVSWTDCFEIGDDDDELVGFVAFDTTDDVPDGELWCAQIASLIQPRNLTPDGSEYNPCALCYCLVVARVGNEQSNQYRRVGIAEVQDGWIDPAEKVELSLI